MALTLTKDNFEQEVLNSEVPVLVDFWAAWCGPCKMVGPIIDELSQELSGSVKVGKVNIDEQGDLAMRYGVMSIPTMAVFKNGQVSAQAVGAMGKDEIKNTLGL